MKKSQQLVHFVSTGPKFPYMYYIGVMTALKVYGNGARLWITEEPQSEYFRKLKGRVKINKIAEKIPDFPALTDKEDHFKRVAAFDYWIWDIVYKFGGMIMGLDSLTLRPHFDLLEDGKELMAPRDNLGSFWMHGVIVRKGSKIAKLIIIDALASLFAHDMERGDSGILPFIKRSFQNLDKISIGPSYMFGGDVYGLQVFRNDVELHPDTRTIPLALSASLHNVKVELAIDENYVAKGKSLYARLIKKMLSEEEWNGSLWGPET